MTSGSRLEEVSLLRSLGGSIEFGPVLESSWLPLTIPQALPSSRRNGALVHSWRGCLVRSLLGSDVFPRGAMRWTG
jgi:hypothetical protein